MLAKYTALQKEKLIAKTIKLKKITAANNYHSSN